MQFSGKQVCMVLLLATLLCLQLVLGESPARYLLYALWSVFIIWQTFFTDRSLYTSDTRIATYLVVFCAALGAGSFFTHSIPLTVDELMRAVFYASLFLFFSRVPEKIFSADMLMIAVLLSVLSTVLLGFLVQGLGVSVAAFPDMNVLVSRYGHNHIAAVVLIVLPLAWWYAAQFKNKFLYALPLLFVSSCLLSFGRVATGIMGIQLFITAAALSRTLHGSAQKGAKIILWSVIAVVSLVVTAYLVLISLQLYRQKSWCPTEQLSSVLCKAIREEPRLYFWKQALSAAQDFPLTGYGPGTFQLVSVRYQQTPSLHSRFAHNELLQFFAENGAIVTILSLILFVHFVRVLIIAWYTLPQQKKAAATAVPFILLGSFSFLLNNFFDYDWHFTGSVTLFLLLLALVYRTIVSTQPRNQIAALVVQGVFSSILILVSAAFVCTSLHISRGRADLALRVFPFFIHQYAEFQKSPLLSDSEKNALHELYTWHSFIYTEAPHEPLDYERYCVVDLWSCVLKLDPLSLESTAAAKIAATFIERTDAARITVSYDAFLLRQTLSDRFMHAFAELKDTEENERSYNYFLTAVAVDPWSIHRSKIKLNWYVPSVKDCQLLAQLLPIDPHAFGDQSELYAWAYIRCLVVQPATVTENKEAFIERAVTLAPWLDQDFQKELTKRSDK